MKVFGINYGGTHRAIVACNSQRKVAELVGCSVRHVAVYGCVTGNAEEIALASANPGTVFLRKNGYSGNPWQTLDEYKRDAKKNRDKVIKKARKA